MADELFLGLDLGTSGTKLVAFDRSGRAVAHASRSYRLNRSAPGHFELDPDGVWAAAVECFAELDLQSGDDRPVSLAISSQGEAVIPVDREGRVLAASPVSADMRGVVDAERLGDAVGPERIYQITGTPLSTMASLTKIMWWRRESPGIADHTWKYLCFGDFALMRLGLEPRIDESMAARTLAYDIHQHRWSTPMLDAAGIDSRQLPDVVASDAVAGMVPDDIAARLRLPPGVAVIVGGHDQPMGALGAGVAAPGEALYAIGTTEALAAVAAAPSAALGNRNIACYPHVVPGQSIALAGSQTGGRALAWLAELLNPPGIDISAAIAEMIATAGDCMPSLDSPIFLAHLAGSGTVLNDPASTGAFSGLSFGTDRGQVVRAVLEGISFEQAIALEAMAEGGILVGRLRAAGGGTRSPGWLAMKADILNRQIAVVQDRDAPCLGAAILGSVATGRHGSINAAITTMVALGQIFEPRPERHELFVRRLATYRGLYKALKRA
ncbi:MAG: hypothetical protein GY798_21830 [Hyphomicrobiales bacterium]|nr:hypothetical protein [Hyphomicrobiales bacterium]